MRKRFQLLSALGLLAVGAVPPMTAQTTSAKDDRHSSPLTRSYREGEALSYHMTATNQGRNGTIRYEADASGRVKKTPSGGFAEQYAWSNLSYNGQAMSLPASDFRQALSLDLNAPPALPDFSRINPMLIGPAADLMTFYVDEWLVIQQSLQKSGDHTYVKSGTANSWADGVNTILGQDSIDFAITLSEVNAHNHTAKVVVRHVPPQKPQIQTPVKWMEAPVADTPNNWVEVSKANDGKYFAEIGKETFDVELTISLADGKILSATMDNPVVVLARQCADAALTQCGEPEHYQIRRQVEIKLVP
jgi:hypothetical protein